MKEAVRRLNDISNSMFKLTLELQELPQTRKDQIFIYALECIKTVSQILADHLKKEASEE